MLCPSCESKVAAGSWICPHCDFILDPSVLGAGGDATPAPRPVWSDAPVEQPEAMILGDVNVDPEDFQVLSGAAADGVGKTSTFLFYTSGATSRVLRPDVIPEHDPSSNDRSTPTTPYEDFILGAIDGKRSVRDIQRSSGLAPQEVTITLLTLLDKRVIRIIPPRKGPPPPPATTEEEIPIAKPRAQSKKGKKKRGASRVVSAPKTDEELPAVAPSALDATDQDEVTEWASAPSGARERGTSSMPSREHLRPAGDPRREREAEARREHEARLEAEARREREAEARRAREAEIRREHEARLEAEARRERREPPPLPARRPATPIPLPKVPSAILSSATAQGQARDREEAETLDSGGRPPKPPPLPRRELPSEPPRIPESIGPPPLPSKGTSTAWSRAAERSPPLPGEQRPRAERTPPPALEAPEVSGRHGMPAPEPSREPAVFPVEPAPLSPADDTPPPREPTPPPVRVARDDPRLPPVRPQSWTADEPGDRTAPPQVPPKLDPALLSEEPASRTAPLPAEPRAPAERAPIRVDGFRAPEPPKSLPPQKLEPPPKSLPPIKQEPSKLPPAAKLPEPKRAAQAPERSGPIERPREARGPAGSQMAKAARLFEEAVKNRSEGNLVSARMNMKLALTFDPGNALYQKAYDDLIKNAHIPNNAKAASAAKKLYDEATGAERLARFDEAIELLEQALREYKDPAVYNRLGVLLAMKRNEFDRARELIETALELSPGNATYEHNLSKVLQRAAAYDLRAREAAGGGKKKDGLLGSLLSRKK